MNPALLQAAQEISERSGKDLNEILSHLKVIWPELTGQPAYLSASLAQGESEMTEDVSIEDFV